jgi:hypothetical protein
VGCMGSKTLRIFHCSRSGPPHPQTQSCEIRCTRTTCLRTIMDAFYRGRLHLHRCKEPRPMEGPCMVHLQYSVVHGKCRCRRRHGHCCALRRSLRRLTCRAHELAATLISSHCDQSMTVGSDRRRVLRQ